MNGFGILAVNPGSTTTKLALYRDQYLEWDIVLEHGKEELAALGPVRNQLKFRLEAAIGVLPPGLNTIHAVVGRGGLLRPLEGGVYAINESMLQDLAGDKYGEHPSNLGASMAVHMAKPFQARTYVVDPVVTDEMADHARLTGLPGVNRRSVFHALSQRGAAREAAESLDLDYITANILVLHLGGGISIGAHRMGKVVDVINGLDGEGPMSPERTGSLPVLPMLEYYRENGSDYEAMRRKVLREGGLWAHLGTNDLREAEKMAGQGNEQAGLVLDAMAYQIAKSSCSLLPALSSRVDAVVITGGMAHSEQMVDMLTAWLGPLAPVLAITGVEEMAAMAQGALRVLRGEEEVRVY